MARNADSLYHADGRMLSARKKLKSWCKRHGLTMKELEAHSKQIGLDIAELDKHCAIIEKVSCTEVLECELVSAR